MAPALEFRGFRGVVLRADESGAPENPTVLLLHGEGKHETWAGGAEALASAGRHVISLNLFSQREAESRMDGVDAIEAQVEDLRCVLDQLASRPVVATAAQAGWIAILALAGRDAHLVSGLILADTPDHADPRVTERVAAAGALLTAPVLHIRNAQGEGAGHIARAIPQAEFAELELAGAPSDDERADAFNSVLLDFLERKAPRAAPEFRAGSDPRTLRDAMGCFATGVTIVTAMSPDGEPIGLTANSFTSVSLDPPLLLVCIARSAGSLPALAAAEHFAINVLHIGQQPASNRFAKRGEDRFAATLWERGQSGAPLLTGSLAAYECAREALHEAGDHVILIGRVVRARVEPQRDPLLFFRGKYRRLHFS
jgi:flavin reductase (DIM6/NTAB) family NADH-FMN oxidoreductase RutF/dienelactone hydrolase